MGRHVAAVFILVLIPFYSDATVIRMPSIAKDIRVYVDINISSRSLSPIDVRLYNRSASLVWDANDRSFHRVRFDYAVEMDRFRSGENTIYSLREITYRVGLRDITLSCSTRTGFTHYQTIDTTRVNGFGNVSVQWGNGSENPFNALGADVVSPEGLFRLADNDALGRKIAVSEGTINVQFPRLSREAQAGGAVCRGGALFLFASVL